jgi:hypothetical protein
MLSSRFLTEDRFKSDYQKKKEARDKALLADYKEMSAIPGASKGAIDDYLVKKYGLSSRTTVWKIRKRAEEMEKEGI